MPVTNPHDAEEQLRSFLGVLYEAQEAREAQGLQPSLAEVVAYDRALKKCMLMLGLQHLV